MTAPIGNFTKTYSYDDVHGIRARHEKLAAIKGSLPNIVSFYAVTEEDSVEELSSYQGEKSSVPGRSREDLYSLSRPFPNQGSVSDFAK